MKTSMRIWLILRIIYGAFFVATGLGVLASILGFGSAPEQPTKAAADFMQALTHAQFIDPLLALSFVAGGGLMICNRTAPAGLVLLAPSVAVILFFHLVLSGQYFWGSFVAAYYVLLAWHYRQAFVPLWSYRQED